MAVVRQCLVPEHGVFADCLRGAKGRLLQFNQLGDYFNGLYLYAFSIQRGFKAVLADLQPWPMFAYASLIDAGMCDPVLAPN